MKICIVVLTIISRHRSSLAITPNDVEVRGGRTRRTHPVYEIEQPRLDEEYEYTLDPCPAAPGIEIPANRPSIYPIRHHRHRHQQRTLTKGKQVGTSTHQVLYAIRMVAIALVNIRGKVPSIFFSTVGYSCGIVTVRTLRTARYIEVTIHRTHHPLAS